MKSASPKLQVTTNIVSLPPGLYAFRYKADRSEPGSQYTAGLMRAPLGSGTVEFFGTGGAASHDGNDAELRHLEDCVVVRVSGETASVLIAEYFEDKAALTSRMEIVIDRLDGVQRKTGLTLPGTAPALPYSVKTLSAFGDLLPVALLGHIELKGDVSVEDGWLGDPQATARIEGLMAQWPQPVPANVELYYGCAAGDQDQISMVPSGTFAGSRGKSLPINALCFDLRGPEKERYTLVGQAVFANTAPMNIHAGKVLTGPSGNEPLVAIYLVAIRKLQKDENKPSASAWEDPSVTKVFRKKDK
jgi:hypothetical protein